MAKSELYTLIPWVLFDHQNSFWYQCLYNPCSDASWATFCGLFMWVLLDLVSQQQTDFIENNRSIQLTSCTKFVKVWNLIYEKVVWWVQYNVLINLHDKLLIKYARVHSSHSHHGHQWDTELSQNRMSLLHIEAAFKHDSKTLYTHYSNKPQVKWYIITSIAVCTIIIHNMWSQCLTMHRLIGVNTCKRPGTWPCVNWTFLSVMKEPSTDAKKNLEYRLTAFKIRDTQTGQSYASRFLRITRGYHAFVWLCVCLHSQDKKIKKTMYINNEDYNVCILSTCSADKNSQKVFGCFLSSVLVE